MKMFLMLILACAMAPAQMLQSISNSNTTISAGGLTYINSGGDWTGGGSLATGAWHPTAGNHLIVWTIANDATQTHTCSDNASGGSNTYVADAVITNINNTVTGRIFHVKTISNSGAGALTITCTGATPAVAAVEYSGGTGDLDTTSAGTNPSSAKGNSTTITPAAFTPTTADTIHMDAWGSDTGGTATMTQVDGSYTTRSSCLTGASCFVGAIGTRVVTSSASYANGMTIGTAANNIVMHAAYK